MNYTDQAAESRSESMLSERIAKAREAAGISRQELASRMGLQEDTIAYWETERCAPRSNRLVQLAGILNVPLLWLVGGAEVPADLQPPDLSETARIEQKLRRAETLVTELAGLLGEIRNDVRWVQSEFDAEI